MEYLKVEWLHSNDQYPILLFSELDEDRMEIRKVEQYRDGKFCFADHERATGDTQLILSAKTARFVLMKKQKRDGKMK